MLELVEVELIFNCCISFIFYRMIRCLYVKT